MSSMAAFESRRRCVVPASESGMSSAMAMSTGLSSRLGHSTGWAFLKMMTAALFTASVLQCGTAKPSTMPVLSISSRARKAA